MDVAHDSGLPLQMIGSNAIHERHPWLGPTVVAGAFSPEDGAANPRLLAPAIASAAREAGAEINEHSPLDAIAHDGEGFVARSGERSWRARWP